MSKIEKCPFCGKRKISVILRVGTYTGAKWVDVECVNCGARAYGEKFPTPVKNWRQKGIEWWNKPEAVISKKITLTKMRDEQ